MWFMVCRWPQSQEGDWARLYLCKLARHGPDLSYQPTKSVADITSGAVSDVGCEKVRGNWPRTGLLAVPAYRPTMRRAEQGLCNCRASVRLSVCFSRGPQQQTRCCRTDVDRLLHGRRADNQQQPRRSSGWTRAVPRCQRTYKAEQFDPAKTSRVSKQTPRSPHERYTLQRSAEKEEHCVFKPPFVRKWFLFRIAASGWIGTHNILYRSIQ